MKNYSTKIGKIYLTTYVLNILPLPIYDDAKNKEYETKLLTSSKRNKFYIIFQLNIV